MSALSRSAAPTTEAAEGGGRPGWIYRQLGVEPFINCVGVRTIYGGSNPSPEVLAAAAAAAEAFVDLDELAEAIGRRLGELAGAEWGIVTSGTAAALALSTAACIAGNDPELMLRLPQTGGLPNRVLLPAGQRFAYDNVIRMVGAEIATVASAEQLAAALDGSVVMICILGRADPRSPLPLRLIAPVARAKGVPILVDAAGLRPARPDPWLQQGADLVVYSGGKYLRAPQSTGLLLGAKQLCQAAWFNGAPHQAFGRPMKIGKEEMIGALTALEHWITRRRPDVEEARWHDRLRIFAERLASLQGVTTEVMPAGPSVSVPRLRVIWNAGRPSLTGEGLRLQLLGGTPRVLLHDFWATDRSIVIDPFNLSDRDAELAADAIASALSQSRAPAAVPEREAPVDISGRWDLSISFLHGEARHRLEIRQAGDRVAGTHRARASTGTVEGTVAGNRISLLARHALSPMPLYYSFSGSLEDDLLGGDLRLGATSDEHNGPVLRTQFGPARWRASNRERGQRGLRGDRASDSNHETAVREPPRTAASELSPLAPESKVGPR